MQFLIVAIGMLTSSRDRALSPLRREQHRLLRQIAQMVGGLLLLVLMASIFILLQLLVTA